MTPVLAAKIEHWPIGRLVPYARNARTHSPAQVEQIARSIQTFGFTNPILVDGAQGILAGHGRLQAAQKMKLAIVPVIVLDHLSEAERRAYILADNKLAENAGWDDGMLAAELAEIRDMDFGLDVIGFDERELAKLLGVPDDAAADECPEVSERAVTAAGDLWVLGRHRLLCGDATRREDVERVMAGARADMVFTDPPYGYEYESNYHKGGNPFGMLRNDDRLVDFIPLIDCYLARDAAVYVCASHQTVHLWRPLIEACFTYKNLIVWKKNNWSMGDLEGAYAGQHELILFAHKGRVHLRGERFRDVWEFDREPPKDHPTQKPAALVAFAIANTSDRANIVIDMFAGSGSTLIACEMTDRVARLVEIDPKYCDVIVKRWQTYAGGRATRERDGRTFDECAIAADELEIPLNCTAGQQMLGARDVIAEEAFAEGG